MGGRRLVLHPERLFPPDAATRAVAVELYAQVRHLPIVSPHGHTDPRWFADDVAFSDPLALLVTPDHYLTRMLHSQGVAPETLGIRPLGDDPGPPVDPRRGWRIFADHYHLFLGTPSGLWLDQVLGEVFGVEERLGPETADVVYDRVADALTRPEFRPRAVLDRFGIEILATTDSPLDDLEAHAQLAAAAMTARVLPTFRPDPVVDPGAPSFAEDVGALGTLTGEDTTRWSGYLDALRTRREVFRRHGATATDHGHPTARTVSMPPSQCQRLLHGALAGTLSGSERELFRAQMLLEMARMSVEDGLVMQLHPGSCRNHDRELYARFGPDRGGDIPRSTEYTDALRPLLDELGHEPRFRLVLFTLDESTFSRELAPLAGHYPCVLLGAPWWFLDSVEGMARFRRTVTETAGFANTAGFTDDTRALFSIPARHDMARRVDCAYLAELVTSHRLDVEDAQRLAPELAVGLARRAYRLDRA